MSPAHVTMKEKTVFLSIAFFLVLLFVVGPGKPYAGQTRVIIGLDGAKVEIPSHPERIACLYYPAYDKIVMLSKGSRIGLMPEKATPWAYRFYPELKGIPTAPFSALPDVERLLRLQDRPCFLPQGTREYRQGRPSGHPGGLSLQ